MAVAIEIGPAGTGTPQGGRQPGFLSHVHEVPAALAIGFVVQEGQAAPAGQQDVRPAVVVVVGHGHPVIVEPDLVDAGLGADVLELEVAQVLVQLVGPALDLFFIWTIVVAAAGQENIEQAIAIVIEHAGAAAEGLEDGQVPGFFTILVGVVDPAAGGDVLEKGRILGDNEFGFCGRRMGVVHVRDGQQAGQRGDGRQAQGPKEPEPATSSFRHGSPLSQPAATAVHKDTKGRFFSGGAWARGTLPEKASWVLGHVV